MHVGYFDFASGNYDVMDVVKVTNHLHDALLRIILTMVGYDGTYQPTVLSYTDVKPVDWVKPNMPASKLGY